MFIVFGQDIIRFVDAFTKASMYSIWRSLHNKFVFAHVANELNKEMCTRQFFEGNCHIPYFLPPLIYFISDQANLLFVVRDFSAGTVFEMKTNKYVGPRGENPAQLRLLDRYYASEQRFQEGKSLFPDKLKNLKGREVTIAGFDYRPYTVIKQVSLTLEQQYNLEFVCNNINLKLLTYCVRCIYLENLIYNLILYL